MLRSFSRRNRTWTGIGDERSQARRTLALARTGCVAGATCLRSPSPAGSAAFQIEPGCEHLAAHFEEAVLDEPGKLPRSHLAYNFRLLDFRDRSECCSRRIRSAKRKRSRDPSLAQSASSSLLLGAPYPFSSPSFGPIKQFSKASLQSEPTLLPSE